MKRFLFLLAVGLVAVVAAAAPAAAQPLPDSAQHLSTDTAGSLPLNPLLPPDTVTVAPPGAEAPYTLVPSGKQAYQETWKRALETAIWGNPPATATALPQQVRRAASPNLLFYMLAGLTAVLAFFRVFYERYFFTLFRVFFNTTLRQSQLTDQLLQAKLASLLFNGFFLCSGGFYLAFMLAQVGWLTHPPSATVLLAAVGLLALIYATKYSTLRFTGWVSGQTAALQTYTFIIFLINKILGILLLPFVLLMAFSDAPLKQAAAFASLAIVGIFFLMRFVRSYPLLQHQLRVSRFHFLLYIIGVELLPLALLYKGLVLVLNKNA